MWHITHWTLKEIYHCNALLLWHVTTNTNLFFIEKMTHSQQGKSCNVPQFESPVVACCYNNKRTVKTATETEETPHLLDLHDQLFPGFKTPRLWVAQQCTSSTPPPISHNCQSTDDSDFHSNGGGKKCSLQGQWSVDLYKSWFHSLTMALLSSCLQVENVTGSGPENQESNLIVSLENRDGRRPEAAGRKMKDVSWHSGFMWLRRDLIRVALRRLWDYTTALLPPSLHVNSITSFTSRPTFRFPFCKHVRKSWQYLFVSAWQHVSDLKLQMTQNLDLTLMIIIILWYDKRQLLPSH